MTNPFAGGFTSTAPQPQSPPTGGGGFTSNPEAAQDPDAPSPFSTGGFGQPNPNLAPPPQPAEQAAPASAGGGVPKLAPSTMFLHGASPTAAPAPAQPSAGHQGQPPTGYSPKVQPMPGTNAVTPEGVRPVDAAHWRLGDPVQRRSDLGAAPGPYIASRAPVELPSGRETTTVPGMPTYPMPGPIREFEVKRDRYGRYCLPDPNTGKNGAFTRATTVAKGVGEAGGAGLEDWKDRKLIYGLVQNPELLEGLDVGLIGTDQEHKLNRKTAAIAEAARVAAGSADGREFGTALHAWTEAIDIGKASFEDVPDPMKHHIASYLYMVNRAGMIALPEYVERIVYCPLAQSVGTVDRIFQLSDGRLVIGDIKTSANIDSAWTSITTQLAQYATASHMLSADGSRWEPMPPVDQNIAVVASIPHTPRDRGIHCDMVPINLQPGVAMINLAMAVREANSSKSRRAIALDPMVMECVASDAVAAVREGLPPVEAIPAQSMAVSDARVEAATASVQVSAPEGLDMDDPKIMEAVVRLDSAGTVEEVVPMWQEWWPDALVVHAQRRIAEIQARDEANAKRAATLAAKKGAGA